MDDAAGRTGPEAEPAARSADVLARDARPSRLRGRIVLAGLIAAGLAAGWYWWSRPASQPAGHGGGRGGFQLPPQPVGAATINTPATSASC